MGTVESSGADDRGAAGARWIVVVPHAAGPLIDLERSGGGRDRDDLDVLIDDLLPDTDEGPGWFDAALGLVAAGLVGWGLLGDGPRAAIVVGSGALALGAILPVRWAWRRLAAWARQRRRRRLAGRGVPLDAGHPVTARLVVAYDALLALLATAGAGAAAASAAHGALLEVATLLRGRGPASPAERDYVTARVAAIEALSAVVGQAGRRATAEPPGDPDPDLVVEARRELDALTGGGALARLDQLTADARRERQR